MRRLLLLLAALLALPAAAKEGAAHFSAMTYNIRLDLASDGDNAWPHRRAALTGLVAYYAPDIVGMQEVLLHQKQAIEADLPDYAFVGAARDDGKEAGEFSPIGYRTDRFALRASGTFWLSPTPAVPGKGWDAAYPRIATWARLQDKRSGGRLLILNTHFDHVGATAQLESARQIRRWIAAHRQARESVIAMGDFNSPTGSPAYIAMAEGGALFDTLAISRTPHFGPRGTFTAFQIDQSPAEPIDHIFVGDRIAVLRHATLTQQMAGKLPSDHYPVLADLCVGTGC
ncbi:MAG: endonuclease/exonuclease/phosphatase family protein [Sphingopyxis sp.]|uniref:endonuclease/exonuclease/phosphatase family protein n=1 Tax=Sphingopyxis sp. TaxID=1908224 RepID=UPI002ABB8A50|nr:endonuclease/exonuclease/phosphatase family protein [Sphingopyxis sp.]MDZ3832803.1 endonuclease/exonuclease/phosphatase family protein [Sphingopyxis sp.]